MRKGPLAVTTGLVAIALIIALAASDPLGVRGPLQGGGEVSVLDDGWYEAGWSRDIGQVFSTSTAIHLTEAAKGPIRVIEVNPVNHQGGAAVYLGAIVRETRYPDDYDPAGLFTTAAGFPPEGHQVQRFHAPAQLEVHPPEPGQEVAIHVIMGYVAVTNGVMTRDGVEVVYEYQGRPRRVVEPNRLLLCVPEGFDCERPDTW